MWSYFIYIGAGVRSQLVPSDGICILCFFQNLISLDFCLISGCFTPVHSAISSVFFFFYFVTPSCWRILTINEFISSTHCSSSTLWDFLLPCVYLHCAPHLKVFSGILLQNSTHLLKPSSNAIFMEIQLESLLLLNY